MAVGTKAPITSVVGRTGSGKTVLMGNIILANIDKDVTFIVYGAGSCEGQFETLLPSDIYERTTNPSFIARRNGKKCVLIFHGLPTSENFEEFLRSVFHSAGKGRVCLVLDEAHKKAPNGGNLHPYIDTICQEGRHQIYVEATGESWPSHGVSAIFGFRRFATIHKTLTTQTKILFIKKQTAAIDLKTLANYLDDLTKPMAHYIRTMKPENFLRFDDATLYNGVEPLVIFD